MVVAARVAWLQKRITEGCCASIHVSRACPLRPLRSCFKFTLSRPTCDAGDVAALAVISSISLLMQSHTVWDRGHKHSDGITVVRLYIEPKQIDPVGVSSLPGSADAPPFRPQHVSAVDEDSSSTPRSRVVDATAKMIADNLKKVLVAINSATQPPRTQLKELGAMWESINEVGKNSPEGLAFHSNMTRLIGEQSKLDEEVATKTTNVIDADLVGLGIAPSSVVGVAVHRLVLKLCNISTDEAHGSPDG